jgi:hypothetical protein
MQQSYSIYLLFLSIFVKRQNGAVHWLLLYIGLYIVYIVTRYETHVEEQGTDANTMVFDWGRTVGVSVPARVQFYVSWYTRPSWLRYLPKLQPEARILIKGRLVQTCHNFGPTKNNKPPYEKLCQIFFHSGYTNYHGIASRDNVPIICIVSFLNSGTSCLRDDDDDDESVFLVASPSS